VLANIDETIAAIASSNGGAMRGIVRLCGPKVVDCLDQCFRADDEMELNSRSTATVIPGEIRLPAPLQSAPCDLYFWPNARSYTRQPAAEIHTIGSPPILDAVLKTVCSRGARLAEPGEFTMRAFLAGRLDLTQAEAVLGVIDAQSNSELGVALTQLAGGLAAPLDNIRNHLLDALAHLEAGLDFAEEDIEFITVDELVRLVSEAIRQVAAVLDQIAQRYQNSERPRVVLHGLPNVGKSSLLNALVGRERSIVADVAGTTRDYVTAEVQLGQLLCDVVDTAGVESTRLSAFDDSPPETGDDDNTTIAGIAQDHTSAQATQATIRLLCIDLSRPIEAWERRQIESPPANVVFALTKNDLIANGDLLSDAHSNDAHSNDAARRVPNGVRISSVTGTGLAELRQLLAETIESVLNDESRVVSSTAIRCEESLRLALQQLQGAKQTAELQLGEELVAAQLRGAVNELGKVVGVVYTDDILDRIFSRFCIGK
jgi:tRNA modification GTPase